MSIGPRTLAWGMAALLLAACDRRPTRAVQALEECTSPYDSASSPRLVCATGLSCQLLTSEGHAARPLPGYRCVQPCDPKVGCATPGLSCRHTETHDNFYGCSP